MLIEEATWLHQVLRDLAPSADSLVLDIGSSTEYFRRVGQPYIDYYIFYPLRRIGTRILHIDARAEEGVDVVYDFSDPGSPPVAEKIPPGDIVLCCNLLEHVRDRQSVVDRLTAVTQPGGTLVVTVPHVYRYHEDPIDTMYRPTNRELEALFAGRGFEVLRSEILDVTCGYTDAPEGLLPYALYRVRNGVKRRILRQTVKPPACQVAAVVLRRGR